MIRTHGLSHVALAVAEFYGVEAELEACLQGSIAASLRDGCLSQSEAVQAIPGRK